MTEQQLTRLVSVWRKALKLEHWEIQVDFLTAAKEGHLAAITASDAYDTATIVLTPAWKLWDRKFAAQTIVHELMHLHERDLAIAVDSIEGLIDPAAFTIFKRRLEHEREGLVDRLATILVELATS